MAKIEVRDSLKMLRETLCVAEVALLAWSRSDQSKSRAQTIQRMIEAIDKQRPLDSDGRHRQHTKFCGCEGLFDWVKWWALWSRCKASTPTNEYERTTGMYWGRCELDKSHVGYTEHALERGMDIVTWK